MQHHQKIFARDVLREDPRPWENTALTPNTVTFGRVRPSENPLWKQPPPVGKAPIRTKLPLGRTYGKGTYRDFESAGDIIRRWDGFLGPEPGLINATGHITTYHHPRMMTGERVAVGKDFIRMNKRAPEHGAVRPEDQRLYRAMDPLLKRKPAPGKDISQNVYKDDPEHSYGDPSRREKSVREIMAGSAERDFLKHMFKAEKRRMEEEDAKIATYKRLSPQRSIEQWKMKRSFNPTAPLGTTADGRPYPTLASGTFRMRKFDAVQHKVDAPRNWHPGYLPPAEDAIVSDAPLAGRPYLVGRVRPPRPQTARQADDLVNYDGGEVGEDDSYFYHWDNPTAAMRHAGYLPEATTMADDVVP